MSMVGRRQRRRSGDDAASDITDGSASLPSEVASAAGSSSVSSTPHPAPPGSGTSLLGMIDRRQRRRTGTVEEHSAPAPDNSSDVSLAVRRKQRAKERAQLLREGEPALERQECCRRARAARDAVTDATPQSAEQRSRGAISQVWKEGIAMGRREVLSADASCLEPVPKGVDGRSWMAEANLRRTFKEMNDDGKWGRRTGMFGVSPGESTDLAAAVAVAASMLELQREALEAEVAKGGSVAVLQWEMDATPQPVALYSPEARDILRDPRAEGTADVEQKRESHGTRDVFVQRGRIKIMESDDGDPSNVKVRRDEAVFVPPLLLASQFSGTLRDAFFESLIRCGLDLSRLAEACVLVVLIMSVDGCFGNDLVIDWLHDIPPSNVMLLKDLCSFHNVNRIVIDHTKKSMFDINSLFSLARVVHISSYYDLFCGAVLATAFSVPILWVQYGGASAT